MSHIVQIKTEVRDVEALKNACRRLKLAEPVMGKHHVFSVHRNGFGVGLPGWQYPVVCNVETGAVDFDNYNGSWGKQEELDKFLQAYAVEKAVLEAQRNGYSLYETALPDGSIELSITMEA
jgi:hypothetical protein